MLPVTDSMEARLSAIENLLGIFPGKEPKIKDDVGHRLKALQLLIDSTTTEAFRESCFESERLMRDLDAGTALTHQTDIASTPLYYRRQEVLSSSGTFKEEMDLLGQMLNLLLVSQQPREVGHAPLREDEVTRAPIINPTPISREDERRMDVLLAQVNDLQNRTASVASRVDLLLKLYYTLMTMSSEKLVLADEEISAREKK